MKRIGSRRAERRRMAQWLGVVLIICLCLGYTSAFGAPGEPEAKVSAVAPSPPTPIVPPDGIVTDVTNYPPLGIPELA